MRTDSRPSILIVDDEAAIREMVEFTLSVDGIPCVGAANVTEARSLIAEVVPDLILLDWMLPGGESGLEFIKALRADTRRSYIPIIMLTARASSPDKVAALDAGADDYIAKPFSPSELKARIRAVLRRMVLPSDPAHANPAGLGQPAGQIALRAPVGWFRRIPFDDHARSHRIGRFIVIGVDADIADMRKRKGYDLTCV